MTNDEEIALLKDIYDAAVAIVQESWPSSAIYLHGSPFTAQMIAQGHVNTLARAVGEYESATMEEDL